MACNKRYYHNLTHPQKRIWYVDKVNLNSPLHNIGGCLKINESIDTDMLKETINITVKENEGLRLRFIEKDGQPVQYIHDCEKENIDFIDFSSYEMPRVEHQKWVKSLFKRKFELEDNKLYYFAIYKISEKEYGVLLSIHHIISDGWSISLIQKQICEIYSKLAKNETIYFDETSSYVDFIKDENEYLNSDRFVKNKNFWYKKFNNVTEEFLYKTSNSLEGKRKSFNIDSDLSREINIFVEEKKCSLNTFFIAILLIYINKTTSKKDLVIGTPVFNRVGKKQKDMVGMFTRTVPIGYPADNVQTYILDNDFNVVPTGVVGELYVGGDGVARGHLNRKELTYERFIDNPFIRGRKMYKTGDTARYLENGVIEYVGRIDNQVKIRGHRIELGEIEKYLLENEAIKDAVVAFKEDSLGNKLLNAYIVSKKDVTDLELKSWLLKFLPKYMIPTNFIHLEQLPLTVNGKVNYDLLPNPILVENEFVKSKTDVGKEVVKAMEEILGVENISMRDNYYQLGGDSIKAIQISSKLKNVGLDIKVKDILNHDFIEEIAATVEINKGNRAISQEKCMGDIHNTPIIEWFFNQRFLKENSYNQYILLECNKTLDINKVTIAVNKLVEHHDELRINYNKELSKLYYNNQHLNEPYNMQYFNLSEYSCDEQRKEIKKINDELKVKFHIENSLLFNLSVFNLGDGRQALLFTAHHLIVDGVSWRIILTDLVTILNQLDNNEDVKLPMKTHSFKEWSEQLQNYMESDFEEEKVYWNSISDKNFNYSVDFNGEKDIVKTSIVLSDELDEDITNALIKKSNEIYNIELNEVLIIAIALTINKITDDEEIVIELERHGRESINDYIDVSRTVGWFTSMYPAYLKIDHEEIDSNIKSIKEQLRTIPNKGFNYGALKFLNHELKEDNNKYIRFNYLGDFDNIIGEEGLNIANIEFGLNSDEENSLTALMDIVAMIVNKKLKISIAYSNNRFKNGTIQRFIDIYIETLKLILDHCISKSFKEFTPSDFDAVDISQEDLDNLFF